MNPYQITAVYGAVWLSTLSAAIVGNAQKQGIAFDCLWLLVSLYSESLKKEVCLLVVK